MAENTATHSVYVLYLTALATRKLFSHSTNQNSCGKSLNGLAQSLWVLRWGQSEVDHFLCTIINRVCVLMLWWRDNSVVFCGEWKSLGSCKYRWLEAGLWLVEGWERMFKCPLPFFIYMQICVAYTLLQMLSGNTLPQNILLKRCQIDLAPTRAMARLPAILSKIVLSIPQCSQLLLAAIFLDHAAH